MKKDATKCWWTDLDEVKVVDHKPVLFPIQLDLLERGRLAFAPSQGIRRVIWQASCGAGKTVVASEQTRRATENGKTVLHVVHRRRLVDQMVGTLEKFGLKPSPVMEGRPRWTSNVYCASRDTLLATLKAGGDLPRADVILWDEAHVAATELQKWYLENCPEALWTGYTATPVRPNGDSLNPPYQRLVCMAPASDLLKIGRLCPVKVFNPDHVGQRRRKGEKVKPVGDPIDHWKKYALALPSVVFAANVAESKAVCQRYNDAGIPAEHIDASTPEDDREETFERSRTGATKIICNCGVLIEGVDLPWLVCCQILRGCNSLVLWIQSTGRVLRSYPGKTHGIVLDHSGAAHEFGMPDSDFQWTLEDGAANTKANKPRKDRKPVACLNCGCVFIAKPACPECGKMLPKSRRAAAGDMKPGDGVLTEFSETQNGHIATDTLMRLWKKALYTGRAKGWRMGQVAAMFSRSAHCPPWAASLGIPLPTGSAGWRMDVTEWMESQKG